MRNDANVLPPELGCVMVGQESVIGCNRLAPLESVIGALMCGISVSLLFAIVTRLINHKERSLPKEQGAVF